MAATGFLVAGEADVCPDDGGECFLGGGTGDFLPPTPAGLLMVRSRGGDGDVRPARGESFCRLLEGTGEADLLEGMMRLGGILYFLNRCLSFGDFFAFRCCTGSSACRSLSHTNDYL